MSVVHKQRGSAQTQVEQANNRYSPRSERLSYQGPRLTYQHPSGDCVFNLAELTFPPTAANHAFTSLSEEADYVNTALAIADRRVMNGNQDAPAPRMITRQLYLVRHVLDWLRDRGVYRLADATPADTDALIKAFSAGGWPGALGLTERWHHALDRVSAKELEAAFHYKVRVGGVKHIETLYQPFWRSRIGWGGILPLPAVIKARLEGMVTAPLTEGWARREPNSESSPGRLVVRNTLGWLNDFCLLPPSVDRFRHRVSQRPATTSARLSKKAPTRTANLPLEDAISCICAALRLQYEMAPRLIKLYRAARAAQASDPDAALDEDWLSRQQVVSELAKLSGKPISRWLASGSYAKSTDSFTVDQLLGAVQGACAIVLASMNARRQREICDNKLGVRVGDLVVVDDEVGIYQALFYIEKTYFARHAFYINRASADALRCLEDLKEACLPDGMDLARGASLFSCGRRRQSGVLREAHLAFTVDSGRTRSLVSFLQVALRDRSNDPVLSAHMFRRFYAILYFHQYEHAELRALKQHLRHLDVVMTRVYVTDPTTRPLAEQIRSTLGRERFHMADERLRAALDDGYADLEDALAEIEREKLHQAVEQILSGRPTAGGFSRIVRKLYRQMLPRVSALDAAASAVVAERLIARGYRVKPMEHGQCHAPDSNRHLRAKCERGAGLARELASASLCNGCPYHFNNDAYIENLREDLVRLDSESHDVLLPPLQQSRAAYDHGNLCNLIGLLERQMRSNADQMRTLHACGDRI